MWKHNILNKAVHTFVKRSWSWFWVAHHQSLFPKFMYNSNWDDNRDLLVLCSIMSFALTVLALLHFSAACLSCKSTRVGFFVTIQFQPNHNNINLMTQSCSLVKRIIFGFDTDAKNSVGRVNIFVINQEVSLHRGGDIVVSCHSHTFVIDSILFQNSKSW